MTRAGLAPPRGGARPAVDHDLLHDHTITPRETVYVLSEGPLDASHRAGVRQIAVALVQAPTAANGWAAVMPFFLARRRERPVPGHAGRVDLRVIVGAFENGLRTAGPDFVELIVRELRTGHPYLGPALRDGRPVRRRPRLDPAVPRHASLTPPGPAMAARRRRSDTLGIPSYSPRRRQGHHSEDAAVPAATRAL